MTTPNKPGGKRENAGRPKSEPTKVITFRVRETEIDHIRKVVKLALIKLRGKK